LKVHLRLYSILREKLPPEAKGRAVLHLNEKATIADLLEELNITRRVVISLNGVHEADRWRQLKDGDEIKIFSSISGGQFVSQLKRPDLEERA
jgi:thiamine biosynthesis protein ThiS